MVFGQENERIAAAHVGYARVSTLDQDPALQLDALAVAGCTEGAAELYWTMFIEPLRR
jgi:hypothetical protein